MGKSGPQCTICAHERRAAIEVALVGGMGTRQVAARFGVSRDSVARHSANHLGPAQRAAILAARKPGGEAVDVDALKRDEAEGLLSNILASRARLAQLAEQAASMSDVKAAAAVERVILENLTLGARLVGQLVNVHEHRSLVLTPDYLELRAALLRALRRHPEALADVTAALAKLEMGVATPLAPEPVTIEANRPLRSGQSLPAVIEHEPAAPDLPPLPPLPAPLGPPPC